MIDTRHIGAGSYPEPPEEKMKEVSVIATVVYELTYEVPEKWEKEDIVKDVIQEFDYFNNWSNKKIEDIKII